MARHGKRHRSNQDSPGGRKPNPPRANRRDDHDPGLPALIVAPLVILGLLGAADMLWRESTRPIVGDMVVFAQSMRELELFRIRVPATLADGTGRACALDSQVMARDGGSLLVLRRLPHEPSRYRAHWIGGPTAEVAASCGGDARLEIGRVELRKLATAMGGFYAPTGLTARRGAAPRSAKSLAD